MKHFFGSLIISVIAAMVFTAIGYAWIKYDLEKVSDDVVTLQTIVEELQDEQPTTQPNNPPTNQSINNNINSNSNNTTNNVQPPQNQAGSSDVKEHDVYVTRSDDPTSFPDSTELVFDMGSVPEAVLRSNGEIWMYFPSFKNFSGQGDEKIMAAKSTDDGVTWEEVGLITIEDAIEGVTAVDPSLVELNDRRLRMYFYGSEFQPGKDPAQTEGNHTIYSAVSDDGLTFTMEDGVRYAQEKITDPDVVYHPGFGTWFMYVSEGPITNIITSNDGLEWFDTEFDWTGGGVPGAYVDSDNVVHLYGCGQGGIMIEASVDGMIFDGTPEIALSTTEGIICDPSPVLLDDGSVLMVYKKAPASINPITVKDNN